ncbi:MAG: hypothetical protein WC141_02225 [Arcobacteraceae bacterium]
MELFQKLYIANIDEVSKEVEESFLMCGKNWDFYFTKKDNKTDFEELDNIQYIEFVKNIEFQQFLSTHKVIDYSIEDDKSMVLFHG